MIVETTSRGFQVVEFEDCYGKECSLQQSSLAIMEEPGSSAIWLGREGHRMHLSLEQTKKLKGLLEVWIETGGFEMQTSTAECGLVGEG